GSDLAVRATPAPDTEGQRKSRLRPAFGVGGYDGIAGAGTNIAFRAGRVGLAWRAAHRRSPRRKWHGAGPLGTFDPQPGGAAKPCLAASASPCRGAQWLRGDAGGH